jgi:hypothetical protein
MIPIVCPLTQSLRVALGRALAVALAASVCLIPQSALSGTPGNQIVIMTLLGQFNPPLITGSDAVGNLMLWYARRTAVLIRVGALSRLAMATALYQPTSSQDAITLRNAVAGLLDGEMTRLAFLV